MMIGRNLRRMFFGLGISLVVLSSGLAFGDPEPTVVEDPQGAFNKFKDVVNTLDPAVLGFWDVSDGDWQQAYLVKIYGLKSKGINISNFRAGYGVDKTALASVGLDVQGIIQRYLGAPEDNATGLGVLKSAISKVSEYTEVGIAGGRDFDDHEWAYGAVVGGRINF